METAFRTLTPAQESLFLTLYLRALDCKSAHPILGDATSAAIADKIDYDFTRQKVGNHLVLDVAVRTKKLDELIRAFVAKHPNAVVLDLGCGLDPRVIRCGVPSTVDWYDIDYPVVADIRAQFLPDVSHVIGADLTTPQWMNDIPAHRPAMIVADGLMAFMTGPAYQDMIHALTAHFKTGEFAFNAYTRFVLKIAHLSSTLKALHADTGHGGIDDPHEPERWGARLTLIEELLLVRSPEVDNYPPLLRAFARLCAHSTRISRIGNRLLRYRF